MVANNPLIRPDFLRVAFASVPPSDSHNITKTPREPVLAIPSKRASNVAILAWQISSSGAYPIGYLVIGDSMPSVSWTLHSDVPGPLSEGCVPITVGGRVLGSGGSQVEGPEGSFIMFMFAADGWGGNHGTPGWFTYHFLIFIYASCFLQLMIKKVCVLGFSHLHGSGKHHNFSDESWHQYSGWRAQMKLFFFGRLRNGWFDACHQSCKCLAAIALEDGSATWWASGIYIHMLWIKINLIYIYVIYGSLFVFSAWGVYGEHACFWNGSAYKSTFVT